VRIGFLIPFLLAMASGCAMVSSWTGGTTNLEPPAELAPVEGQVPVERSWKASADVDSRKQFVRLTPTLVDGTVYVAGFNGRVVALNGESGGVRWRADIGEALTGGVGVGEGLALVGTSRGEVIALNAEGGAERWRSMVPSEVLSAPQADFGVVVVRTGDGSLTGLDPSDGVEQWVYARATPALTLRGVSKPLMVQGAAITGMDDGRVAVIDLSSGRPFWERTVSPPRGRSELDRMVDIDATPRIVGRVLYVVTFQGRLAAIDVESGNVLWGREASAFAGLDVDEQAVYVTDSTSTVWAFERRTGSALWRQESLLHRRLTGPTVVGEYVVVGDFEGYLHFLSREDGAERGRMRLGSAQIAAAPVTDGSWVYAVSSAGQVAGYKVR
jgi:outer membrane protein assembly factor BamB